MEINNEFLIKTSFTVSLIGMLLLTIISQNIKYDNIKTYSIVNNNKNVKIIGEVTNIEDKGNYQIIKIKFNTSIKAFYNKEKLKEKNTNLKPRDRVVMTGNIHRGILYIKSIEKLKR